MDLIGVSQIQGRTPVTIFHLQDRVNLGNTAEPEQAAQAAYTGGMQNLIIDLSDTPSVTSAGIGAIVSLHKMPMKDESDRLARHVKLVSPTSYVREVLDIAGLTDYLEAYDNQDDAVASFR